MRVVNDVMVAVTSPDVKCLPVSRHVITHGRAWVSVSGEYSLTSYVYVMHHEPADVIHAVSDLRTEDAQNTVISLVVDQNFPSFKTRSHYFVIIRCYGSINRDQRKVVGIGECPPNGGGRKRRYDCTLSVYVVICVYLWMLLWSKSNFLKKSPKSALVPCSLWSSKDLWEIPLSLRGESVAACQDSPKMERSMCIQSPTQT